MTSLPGKLHPNYKHGHFMNHQMSREYVSWSGMKARCLNTAHHKYKDYGGRGISICERWRGRYGFPNFLADMGPRPKGTSLGRINNDGNYEPKNCRWETPIQQARNCRPHPRPKSAKGCRYKASNHSHPWEAMIKIQGRQKFLGTFSTEKEAHAAYLEARGKA